MDYEDLRQQELQNIVERLKSERNKPSSERVKVLESLEITAAHDIGYILRELFQTETDPIVLTHMCNTFARLKDTEIVMSLIDLMLGNREIEGQDDPLKDDKNAFSKIRCDVIKALGRIGDERATVPLMYVLNEKVENYKVRLNAAEALGRIGNTYAVNPLINLVKDDKEDSVYVKESAARALGMLGDVRAIKPLVEVLGTKKGIFSKFSFLKEQIIEAISKIGVDGDNETLRTLKDQLIDEAPSVRLSAVEAITAIGDCSLIKDLIPAVYDEEEDVAREAVRGIHYLEGYLELQKLLEDDRLPGWSRDEIEMSLEEEE